MKSALDRCEYDVEVAIGVASAQQEWALTRAPEFGLIASDESGRGYGWVLRLKSSGGSLASQIKDISAGLRALGVLAEDSAPLVRVGVFSKGMNTTVELGREVIQALFALGGSLELSCYPCADEVDDPD